MSLPYRKQIMWFAIVINLLGFCLAAGILLYSSTANGEHIAYLTFHAILLGILVVVKA